MKIGEKRWRFGWRREGKWKGQMKNRVQEGSLENGGGAECREGTRVREGARDTGEGAYAEGRRNGRFGEKGEIEGVE